MVDRQSHWQSVYTSKHEVEVSWFQETPAPSLDLLALTGATRHAAIIDIGGGASRLAGIDQAAYMIVPRRGRRPGEHMIIGTFAADGPPHCSGLPVIRYDAEGLAKTLGFRFGLLDRRLHRHVTPWETEQAFQFCTFRYFP